MINHDATSAATTTANGELRSSQLSETILTRGPPSMTFFRSLAATTRMQSTPTPSDASSAKRSGPRRSRDPTTEPGTMPDEATSSAATPTTGTRNTADATPTATTTTMATATAIATTIAAAKTTIATATGRATATTTVAVTTTTTRRSFRLHHATFRTTSSTRIAKSTSLSVDPEPSDLAVSRR